MPAHVFAGDVEILRGDLAQILHEATRDSTEYLFGDSITGLEERPGGVRAWFSHAPPRTFSLVIGADGLRSNVRRLAFGEHDRFLDDLGLFVSIFSMPDSFGLDHAGLLCSVPGRTAGVFSAADGQAIAQLFFAAPGASYDHRDTAQQKRLVAEAFAGMGWRAAELIAAMRRAPDFYFDSVSQVHLDRWSAGRVALLGDAACAAGPGGNGTGNRRDRAGHARRRWPGGTGSGTVRAVLGTPHRLVPRQPGNLAGHLRGVRRGPARPPDPGGRRTGTR
jgi:2-polyprenyl-6-methoxyphenol hydroxylase-like FAD-dependent oxidoreductase